MACLRLQYAAAHPDVGSAAVASADGATTVHKHVIPNIAMRLEDVPWGSTAYNTLAGVPLTVTRT